MQCWRIGQLIADAAKHFKIEWPPRDLGLWILAVVLLEAL
jgi:hypothetical protein